MEENVIDPPDSLHLVPPTPLDGDEIPEGYLQIVLTAEGGISLRGTGALVDWLLRDLARHGWWIALDDIGWCG